MNAPQAGEGSDERVSGGQVSQDVLMDRVAILFQEADTDGNGTLSRAEFQQVLTDVKSSPTSGKNAVRADPNFDHLDCRVFLSRSVSQDKFAIPCHAVL